MNTLLNNNFSPITKRNSDKPLLIAENLNVDLLARDHLVRIIDDVTFSINAGERVGLVGESGSGKSVTAHTLMRLNRRALISGRIIYAGRDLVRLHEREVTRIRGAEIGLVFQDPMSTLDPLMTISDQVAETLRIRGVSKRDARARALKILEELRIDDAAKRMGAYPHELSGGMRQRVVIAMALIAEPRLLIADEPTTALDVRVQEKVLDILDTVVYRRHIAVLLITHDLGIVAGFADRVMVMYSGRIVEDSPVDEIFEHPKHPYTRALILAVPRVDYTLKKLASINGAPPRPILRPSGCAFHPRCPNSTDVCMNKSPLLVKIGQTRVACHLVTNAKGVA